MDYTGAIDEFEKAWKPTRAMPRRIFELGWLYEKPEPEPDSAAAIYHYQQFLKLRPTADTAEAVRQRVMNCKQDLAKAVLPLTSAPGVQHDLEQLVQENKQLKAEVEQWRAYFKAQPTNHPVLQVSTSLPPIPHVQPTQTVQSIDTAQVPRRCGAILTPQTPGTTSRIPPRTSARTYTVQPKDTFASISRKFNVKLDALTAANPGVDARKLASGQGAVNIP